MLSTNAATTSQPATGLTVNQPTFQGVGDNVSLSEGSQVALQQSVASVSAQSGSNVHINIRPSESQPSAPTHISSSITGAHSQSTFAGQGNSYQSIGQQIVYGSPQGHPMPPQQQTPASTPLAMHARL